MIYAISDLHLSVRGDKPMDVFGSRWKNHTEKIIENWNNVITQDDIVLVAGDLSWGMTLDEGVADLMQIMPLPGKKVFIKGNHDYWWQSISKVRAAFSAFPDAHFLQYDSCRIDGCSFCGTRGWLCPENSEFKESEDRAVYERELCRLDMSLKSCDKNCPVIALMHYPPLDTALKPNAFYELLKDAGVIHTVFGHLHGIAPGSLTLPDDLSLTSADYIDFCPVKIL